MGADGHIDIFSYRKVKEKFTDEEIKNCLSGLSYIQDMDGVKYITGYWGDNILLDYSSFEDVGNGDEKLFKDFWDYLNSNCKITSWEVWT